MRDPVSLRRIFVCQVATFAGVWSGAEGFTVSNPDADHIGGFLDVFDAFPVETVYVSGDSNNTLTYKTFLRAVRDEGAKTEVLRAGALMDWGGVRADA
jgi:competence protein ComEC